MALSRGDEVIKFCGDVLLKGAALIRNTFVGHVGGDDFAVILDADDVEP